MGQIGMNLPLKIQKLLQICFIIIIIIKKLLTGQQLYHLLLHMKEANPTHLVLFAKLSKILAETFQDIHKICLSEAENNGNDAKTNSNTKQSSAKQQWLDKRQQSKGKVNGNEYVQARFDNGQPIAKPPKSKKIKTKVGDNQHQVKQKRTQKKKKIAKWEQQGKPRPPINAFMLFLRDSKFQIMQAKPQLTPSEVSSYASALWNDLTQDQKQKYRGQYRQNKAVYDEQIKQYHEKMKILAKAGAANSSKPGGQNNPNKIVKDILDEEVVNIEGSDNSESMSGI